MADAHFLMIALAWPVVLSYACFRIVLVFGKYETRRELGDALVMGFGGACALWARALYQYDVPLDWAFALTLLGVALMLTPKLIGIAFRSGLGQ